MDRREFIKVVSSAMVGAVLPVDFFVRPAVEFWADVYFRVAVYGRATILVSDDGVELIDG